MDGGWRLTFLEYIAQIGHLRDGLVRQGVTVVFQNVGAKLRPDIWPPCKNEERERQQAGCSVAGSEEHVHDLIAQEYRVVCVLGELVEEDILLAAGGTH